MRPLFVIVLFGVVNLAGCMKFQALDMSKSVELGAQEVKTPIILDPVKGDRAVSVTVTCDAPVDAFLVRGSAEDVENRLSGGREPKEGTYFAKIGGKGAATNFDLKADELFTLILRNPGNKKITAEVKLTSKSK